MVNIDATTPRLKAAKRVVDAYSSRDLVKSGSVFSKDFKFQSFPRTANHVEETKEEHFKNYRDVLSSYVKTEPIVHEIVEGSGKVVLHMTTVWTATDGTAVNYDTVLIFSLVQEDGELKVLEIKDFSDPEKRNAFHSVAAKTLAKGGLAA